MKRFDYTWELVQSQDKILKLIMHFKQQQKKIFLSEGGGGGGGGEEGARKKVTMHVSTTIVL